MNIPVVIVWEIILAVMAFVLGTLWGHHSQIGKRVTYEDCSRNRDKCLCRQELTQQGEYKTKKRKGKR